MTQYYLNMIFAGWRASAPEINRSFFGQTQHLILMRYANVLFSATNKTIPRKCR